MDKLKEEIIGTVMQELNRVNEKFPLFASKHEGYAVIREELEETEEALEYLKSYIECLWENIRGKPGSEIDVNAITKQAINLACEATQTAAMLMKYSMSLPKKD